MTDPIERRSGCQRPGSALVEDYRRPNRSNIDMHHPAAPMPDATSARRQCLANADQARRNVSCPAGQVSATASPAHCSIGAGGAVARDDPHGSACHGSDPLEDVDELGRGADQLPGAAVDELAAGEVRGEVTHWPIRVVSWLR